MKNGRRWSHKDGIPVRYSPSYPRGLSYGIFPLPPDDPIELRAGLRRIREELAQTRRRARVLHHQRLVWERRLAEIIDELARNAVATPDNPTR